jgi:diguanylate cyclase (GGDEF)-like protein
MANSGEPTSPRWSVEESFLELLTDTLDNLDGPARGQFLQRFFHSIAQVDISETESLQYWEQTLIRRRELSENLDKKVPLQSALVDVLTSANLFRLPILMEYEELRKLQINAATDPLTGLYNRRFFDDYFEKELNRSIRYSHKLALVVFDLQRFKAVNDGYGHQRGDLVLRMVAETLRNSMRTSDYAFRLGGDEFALLLPQTDPEQAAALSRRLRAAYAAAIEPLHMNVPLALDYGLAIYPHDGDIKEVLIRVADERLYLLKNGSHPATSSAASAETRRPERARAEEPQAAASPSTLQPPDSPTESSTENRRRWERVSLHTTKAHALVGEGVEFTAKVLDLGYGGVALETSRPEAFEEMFQAVLHVPILPPVRVNLKRIYQKQGSTGATRIGCSFVT